MKPNEPGKAKFRPPQRVWEHRTMRGRPRSSTSFLAALEAIPVGGYILVLWKRYDQVKADVKRYKRYIQGSKFLVEECLSMRPAMLKVRRVAEGEHS